MKTGVRSPQVLEGIIRAIKGIGFAFFFFWLSSLSLFRFSTETLLRAGLTQAGFCLTSPVVQNERLELSVLV